MADPSAPSTPASATATPTDSPASESKAQRDARLRRERRTAKIQAGGSERLSKITSLSGRPAAAEAELTRTPPAKAPAGTVPADAPTARAADDPAEVDISSMFARGAPARQGGQDGGDALRDQQEMLRAMLRQPEPGAGDGAAADEPGLGPQAHDPLMQMMQQLMGSMPGADGASPGQPGAGGMPPGLPPGLANLLNAQMGQGTEQQPARSGDYIWRIVHALFSILLGLYAVATLSFSGSKLDRTAPAEDVGTFGPRLFYLFATAEVVLQSTRYFVDRGRLPRSGWMATVAGILPEPFAEYLRVLNRYSIIYSTVSQDAFVVVFVLGAVAWWKGNSQA